MFVDTTDINQISEATLSEEVVLSVRGVSKKFCRNLKRAMFYSLTDIGGELMGIRSEERVLRKDEFWALENISFNLKKGDAIGLVGANGAGKTTLLKIITGLIKPDKGSVYVRGRIAPLIALGAGFNPVLSGRENVYVNMAILGLTRKEIDSRFDEVVAFAEIGHAIDAPVQTYSSGMAARLGFACAIHTTPDILLIDEVLAVGDMKFRAKCYRKLALLRSSGTSFLLVSHSAQSLLAVCKEGIFLSKGKMQSIGKIEEVLTEYENSLSATVESDRKFVPNKSSEIFIEAIAIKNKDHDFLSYSEQSSIELSLNSSKIIAGIKLILIARANSLEDNYALYLDSYRDGFSFDLNRGINKIVIHLHSSGLKAGLYSLKVAIVGDNHFVHDAVESFSFVVKNFTDDVNSAFYQNRTWEKII